MKELFVTAWDRHRLKDCVFGLVPWVSPDGLPSVNELDKKLDEAEIILEPRETPPDLVTMRSRVKLRDLRSNRTSIYTLAYPLDSMPDSVSVFEPVGIALLGARHGSLIEAAGSTGAGVLEVEKLLFQPRGGRSLSPLAGRVSVRPA